MKTAVHDILTNYFERKKLAFPGYSLRALARDLKVSPAYVSNILSGKKPVPEARLKDLIKILDLDDIAILQLKKALFPQSNEDKKTSISLLKNDDIDFFSKYKPLDKRKYEILNNWYNVAILDLTTCENFQNNPVWIAKTLKITQLEVEMAIEDLKRHGLLSLQDGKLIKVDLKLRFPTKISQAVIRKFHKQMIKKAYEELDSKTEDAEFSNRLISGVTFALNSDNIASLKEKLQNLLYEVSNDASEDASNCVYQLNLQFFPLTR